mgnify:FL=1
MSEKLPIPQWALDDRPREKLERLGAEALSDAELLAILIGSGSAKESAVELMKRVMSDCDNNLNTLGKLTIEELMDYSGIGLAKAVTILAACELGKRRAAQRPAERMALTSAQDIYRYMLPKMQDLSVEEAWIVLMNQSYKVIKRKRISHGGITETSVDVRVIIKEALLCNATVVALCHNHPSDNPHPSGADNQLTQRVKKACDLMRLYFLDHVVVAESGYYSYMEEGQL